MAELSQVGFGPTFHGRFSNGRIEGWFMASAISPEQMAQVNLAVCVDIIGCYIAAAAAAMYTPAHSLERTSCCSLFLLFNEFLCMCSARP
jgi:hypothetical protein